MRIHRGIVGAFALALVSACTSPPREEVMQPAADVEADPVAPIVTESQPAVDEASAGPLSIGWETLPPSVTPEGASLNARALKLHRAGDYEGSLAGFMAAQEASPGHAWARYNAACALSRLGRTEEAAKSLRPLLLEDFPQFRRRLLDDEDLEALRTSPDGSRLAALLPRLAAAYDRALQRGTPAFTYRVRTGWKSEEDLENARTPYTGLRVGIYDHSTRRFVPMTPRAKGAYSGLLLRDRKRAIVATGDLEMKDMWEVQPDGARAVLFSLEDWGDALLRAKHVSPRDDVSYGFELWPGPDDTLYGVHYNVGYSLEHVYYRWTTQGRKKIGWTNDDTGETEPPAEVPLEGPSLEVIDIASASHPAPTGPTLIRKRRAFSVGHEGIEGTLSLEKGHHHRAVIQASPDPMIFTVTSNTIRFSLDGGEEITPTTRDQHVVDRVDMHAKTVTRLAKDRGYAHVAWAPDGTLFLELPDRTLRYAPGSTEPVADVLTGVHFGTPPFPEEGGV